MPPFEAPNATPRHDFYRPVHRGLRLAQARLIAELGATNWRDKAATQTTLNALTHFLGLAQEHLEHEDRVLNPVLQALDPALFSQIEVEHGHHVGALPELADLAREITNATPARAAMLGEKLYESFCAFVAADFVHMAREEGVVMRLFQAHINDAGLQALEGQILELIPLDRQVDYFRLMIPAMTPDQRLDILAGIQAGAPAEVFAVIMDQAARQALDPVAYSTLAGQLRKAA